MRISPAESGSKWTAAVLLIVAPVLVTLLVTLWRTPYPVTEAVALFEDVARVGSPARFWVPDTSYYRPLFHSTLWAIWHADSSLDTKLALVKVVHIAPIVLLVVVFVSTVRPRNAREAAAAALATAVLLGSPGLRDNLEIPLSYTAMAMPITVIVWMLMNQARRVWHTTAIVALVLVAIGFKEQGLILIPIVVAAWWMRASGASRSTAVALVTIGVAYVAIRLLWRAKWPLFEQSIGLGFSIVEASDATARFGAFPYFVFAYNSASTIANVLFSEPTSGLFYTIRDIVFNQIQAWRIINLVSSIALTGAIAWWGVSSLKASRGGWTDEARLFVALVIALLCCGILSFDYSRDRLGGMAVVFYALAAFHAVRALAVRLSLASRPLFVSGAVALLTLAAAWEIRAVGTIEWTRRYAHRNEIEWLVELVPRRAEFADRSVYLEIMERMIPQGTQPGAPNPTHYPDWIARTMVPPQ
jgi:hypothetical protein